MSARLFDKPVDHAEPKASAFANLLRGKEGLEYLLQMFRYDATSGVGHHYQYILSGLKTWLARHVVIVQRSVGYLDRERAAVRHGVTSVQRKVQQGGLKLSWINLSFPKSAGAHDFDRNVFRQGPPQQAIHALD